MATRTFVTSAEQDAAIAWRVAQLAAQGQTVTEAQVIARFASDELTKLVQAYRDAEGSRVFQAYQAASETTRNAVKATLGLS